jgi:hypothetical protein
MEDLKKIVFLQLRCGTSLSEILTNLQKLEKELLTMKDYAKAMEEAHKAP